LVKADQEKMVNKRDDHRYQKHILLPQVGHEGQARLKKSSVVVIGCGGLGCTLAIYIVRSGVGRVVLVDRDCVELDNLHRQILFVEEDVVKGRPKAVAAAEHLREANSEVEIVSLVEDVSVDNVEEIIREGDLVLDGTDNFETRYLVNDACLKHRLPWVYAGVVATTGMVMSIIPGKTPCFRCFLPQPPAPGDVPTCESVGVWGPAVGVIASFQVSEGLKILLEREEDILPGLVTFDVWSGEWETFSVEKNPDCPACGGGDYEYLKKGILRLTTLCGQKAVQVSPNQKASLDLGSLAERLQGQGRVTFNDYVVRLQVPPYEFYVFKDGRAIVKGTSEEKIARQLLAKYIGL